MNNRREVDQLTSSAVNLSHWVVRSSSRLEREKRRKMNIRS